MYLGLFKLWLTSDRFQVGVADASICFLYPFYTLYPWLNPGFTKRSTRSAIIGKVFVTNFSHYDYSVFEHKGFCTNVPYYRCQGKLVWSLPFYMCKYCEHTKRHIVPQIAVDWLENPRVRQKLFGIRD